MTLRIRRGRKERRGRELLKAAPKTIPSSGFFEILRITKSFFEILRLIWCRQLQIHIENSSSVCWTLLWALEKNLLAFFEASAMEPQKGKSGRPPSERSALAQEQVSPHMPKPVKRPLVSHNHQLRESKTAHGGVGWFFP